MEMEISSNIFELVQLDGVEAFIRLCCGVTGILGFVLGMSMICKALILWSDKVLGLSQGEKNWFAEGELESEIEEEMEVSRRAFLSGAKGLPSPEEMENNNTCSAFDLLSARKEKKARRLMTDKFRRSHFKSDFEFKVEMVNLSPVKEEEKSVVLAFLVKKSERQLLQSAIHDGKYIQDVPLAMIGAGKKTANAVYSC